MAVFCGGWRRHAPNISLRKRLSVLLLLGVVALLYKSNGSNKATHVAGSYRSSSSASSRHLLSTVEWEKCDFEILHTHSNPNITYDESFALAKAIAPTSQYGWVALYVFLVLVLFVALAIICDDFFVPSLEAISERLDLSEDVAGATFMAAGSSAPELFTSIAGVSVESDVGVGTIVGSAVFNLLGIVALSAAFAGQTLKLDWRPLCRDATFYALSIAFFILFSWDGKFEWWESLLMFLLYIIYIIIMKFNPKLMKFLDRCCCSPKVSPAPQPVNCYNLEENKVNIKKKSVTIADKQEHEKAENEKTENGTTNEDNKEGVPGEPKRKFSHIKKGMLAKELMGGTTENMGSNTSFTSVKSNSLQKRSSGKSIENGNVSPPTDDGEESDGEVQTVIVCPCLPPVQADVPAKHTSGCCCFVWTRLIFSWILFIISFPFVVLFTWSIPNCSRPETKKWYLLSFTMSIVWIAVLSFAMVTLVGRTGCIIGIDKFTMGLVVVAIGTSIPDALSSILVARDGYGDMAVSNAIGSNVFDIDLGIGFPYLISSMIKKGKAVYLLNARDQELLDSGQILMAKHPKFGFLLLAVLALSLIVFGVARFRLSKYLGLSFVFIYILFVTYTYVQELLCDHTC